MADVYAVFGSLLALGIAFPGMLIAWRVLFPGLTQRAGIRLEHNPWKSLALGVTMLVPLALVLAITFASSFGPVRLIGGMLVIGSLSFASLGASGLAGLMGRRIAELSGHRLSTGAGFVRGALALELAAAFPVIGWLLVIPAVTIGGLGAAGFALLGWMPGGVELPWTAAAGTSSSKGRRAAAAKTDAADEPALSQA